MASQLLQGPTFGNIQLLQHQSPAVACPSPAPDSCHAWHPAGLSRQKLPLETPQAILGQTVFSRYLSVNSFLPHPGVSTPNNFQEEELQQVLLVPLHSDFSAIQRWSHPLQQGILFSPGRVEGRSSSMGVISWLKGGDWHIPAILTLYVSPTYHR